MRARIRDHILRSIRADPRFVGCVDYGSASEGRDDEWSDLDMAFFVHDESLDEINRHWKDWAGQFGTPLLMFPGALEHPWVVYEADPVPLRADFAFHPESNIDIILDWPNSPLHVDSMVLYDDTGGKLSEVVAQIVRQDLGPIDLEKTYEQVCGRFWYYLLRVDGRIRRNELLAAAWQCNYIVMAHLCALLKFEHGALDRFRGSDATAGIEKVITPQQLTRLKRCVTYPAEDELRKALLEAALLGQEVCAAIQSRYNWNWPEQLSDRLVELNRKD